MRKIPNFLKNLGGVPLRIALPMAVIVPVIAKACTKAENKVFGKPTKSVLDDEQEPEQQSVQHQAAQTNNNPFNNQPTVVPNTPTNLLNMYQNGQAYKNPQSTVTHNVNNTTVINGEQKVNDGKTPEPVRTYIPSPVGVQIQGEDTTAAQAALMRADLAEKQALETLAMKW